jgi:hypothetical protein
MDPREEIEASIRKRFPKSEPAPQPKESDPEALKAAVIELKIINALQSDRLEIIYKTFNPYVDAYKKTLATFCLDFNKSNFQNLGDDGYDGHVIQLSKELFPEFKHIFGKKRKDFVDLHRRPCLKFYTFDRDENFLLLNSAHRFTITYDKETDLYVVAEQFYRRNKDARDDRGNLIHYEGKGWIQKFHDKPTFFKKDELLDFLKGKLEDHVIGMRRFFKTRAIFTGVIMGLSITMQFCSSALGGQTPKEQKQVKQKIETNAKRESVDLNLK